MNRTLEDKNFKSPRVDVNYNKWVSTGTLSESGYFARGLNQELQNLRHHQIDRKFVVKTEIDPETNSEKFYLNWDPENTLTISQLLSFAEQCQMLADQDFKEEELLLGRELFVRKQAFNVYNIESNQPIPANIRTTLETACSDKLAQDTFKRRKKYIELNAKIDSIVTFQRNND